MKAAVYYETGGPGVLRYEDVADPIVGPSDVLIEVAAIGIQGGDTLNRLGGAMAATPHIVGYQCAGVVVAVGDSVTSFVPGDRVVTLGMHGSHAALRVTNELFCWSLADGISFADAACVPTEFGTAHDCLHEFGRLREGETVLVHAAASGVGIAAIQLARAAGARVLGTASSDERLERLRPLGLDVGINYAVGGFADQVRAATDGRGADVILDAVGGSVLADSLRCLAYRGRVISFGNAGREGQGPRQSLDQVILNISSMSGNNQTFVSYFLGAELFASSRARELVASMLADVASGALRVVVDRTFPLAQSADAHAYVESRQAFGRVVLVP